MSWSQKGFDWGSALFINIILLAFLLVLNHIILPKIKSPNSERGGVFLERIPEPLNPLQRQPSTESEINSQQNQELAIERLEIPEQPIYEASSFQSWFKMASAPITPSPLALKHSLKNLSAPQPNSGSPTQNWSNLDHPNRSLALNQEPICLLAYKPIYPNAALQMELTGNVTISFTIDEQGLPRNLRVISRDPAHTRIFDRAALQSVRRSKYRPGTLQGKPISQPFIQVVDFDIK